MGASIAVKEQNFPQVPMKMLPHTPVLFLFFFFYYYFNVMSLVGEKGLP